MSRSSASNTLTAKDAETFEQWKDELEHDAAHAPVLKELLRELVISHRLPQGIKFERITLAGPEGKPYVCELPAFGRGAITFERRSARNPDGTTCYDYVRQGDPTNRLLGQGVLR